jgi:hypothetical protein
MARFAYPVFLDRRVTMPHRRTSGAKVRSHKIGIGKTRFKGKQSRLQERKMLMDHFRLGDSAV